VPSDGAPLKPGTRVAYLGDFAKAAGYLVPATAKNAKAQTVHAWAGVRQDAFKVSGVTELNKLVPAVAKRLEREYEDVKNAVPRRWGRRRCAGSESPAPRAGPLVRLADHLDAPQTGRHREHCAVVACSLRELATSP
jgi:hypothetical protein